MKKLYILGAVAVAAALTSCDHLLDENRYPLSSQVNNSEYWSNSNNVDNQINTFYNDYLGYGNGIGSGNYYFKTLCDDQAGRALADWTFTNVPTSTSTWSSPYEEIRRANLVIEGVESSSLTDNQKANYIGIARLNRAFQYYQLVRCFGDVPLVLKALDVTDSEELYGARTNRDQVMDQVLEDLNYAVANISTQSGKQVFSVDMANAMKADICLYEGTYCKYRTAADNAGYGPDNSRAEKYLQEAVNACTPLMSSYSLCDDYHSLYNSILTAGGGITGLSTNPEVIFMKAYAQDVFMHSTIDYTCSSTQISGINKDAFDSFLFKDGKPLALTTMDTNDVGYMKNNELNGDYYYIGDILETRDARLSALTDTVAYYQDMSWARAGAHQMTSTTGYGVRKYDNVLLPLGYRPEGNKNYTCCPIYWLAVIYLNYAEAKAELGSLTDADLDNTINPLMTRAELPTVTKATLENMNDPANNMGCSSLLWEIRRCRRCETMLDADIRYWDLVRWHQLELLDTQKYPNQTLGCNMTGASVDINNVNGYVNANKGNRTYNSKYYFYPVPSNQIALNPNLTQNPGWN